MSEVKVNKISPRTACGTVTLGDSGDTFTVPSGVTITNNGTQTGFGRTGTVDWDTASIKTATFGGVNGNGYFANTTGGVFDLTLPASPTAGDIIAVKDYAGTFDTNALTIDRNGKPIDGQSANLDLSVEGQSVTLVYVDGTKGWLITNDSEVTNLPTYVTATGGTPCTGAVVCTNYKVHTFTGPGTLIIDCVGSAAGSNTVDYMVVAGGGGGGASYGGAGGAGGYRESPGSASGCYTVSPLGAAPAVALPVGAGPYAITVGAGGTGATSKCAGDATKGSSAIFSSITSAGGGVGGASPQANRDGGSGGGGTAAGAFPNALCAGAGNNPPSNPAQGLPGGAGHCGGNYGQGGGGGATVAGTAGSGPAGGPGGTGATSSINATPTQRAGGGGGGFYGPGGAGGAGGTATGGGGAGGPTTGVAGTVNTGGGGGGASADVSNNYNGGDGGSGVVIIRYKFQ